MWKLLDQLEVAARIVDLDREESRVIDHIKTERDKVRARCSHENPGGQPIRSRFYDSICCGVCGAALSERTRS